MENLDLLIRELVQQPTETSWLEFKLNNDDPETIGKDICALANAAAYSSRNTAYFIWGVEDTTHALMGTSFHWRTHKKGNEEFENWLRHTLSPNANFEYDAVQINGKWFGVLVIAAAVDKTVMFNKEEYIRIGSYTKKLNDYPQVKADLWDKLRHRDFESLPAKSNLEISQLMDLLDYPAYFTLQGMSIPEGYDKVLHYLLEDGLIKKQDDGLYCITNLGAILFAKRLADFSGIARKAIRVVQYGGKNKIELLKEYDSSKGYASGFEGIVDLLKVLLPSKEVVEGALRKTICVYPLLAIREAVANALIHQDLSITGTGPVVEIYADRIEICNPGTPLIDIQRIVDTPPKSRNEKLAALTRRMKMCEELGTGWDKIVFFCESNQLPAPEIDLYAENTKVTLFSYIPYTMLSHNDKLRACYFHACLTYVSHSPMNNSSLRKRFGVDEKNASGISRLLKDAVAQNLIHSVDPDTAPRYQRYVPFWA